MLLYRPVGDSYAALAPLSVQQTLGSVVFSIR